MKFVKRARNDFYAFARYLSPSTYQFNWHHHLLHGQLDRFAKKEIKRLIVTMPPGHGKSEAVSRNLPAYLFGQDPNNRLICCSYNTELARDMNRDVQQILESDAYQRVFGQRIGGEGRQTADKFDIVGGRGFYRGAGVGGGITGRRFDYGIIDDPIKDREMANSPVYREKVWRWYTSTFYTRQAKDAAILITTTRWHPDDLVGRLLAHEPERWEFFCLPAIATGEGHPQDERQIGEALWPWLRSEEDWSEMERLEPHDFASLGQQNPIAEGAMEWPESHFDWDGFWFTEWPPLENLDLRLVGLDPSKGSDAKASDYQAIVKYGRDRQGVEYVEGDLSRRSIQASRGANGKPMGDGMVEALVETAINFKAHAIIVETNQFQMLLKVPVMDELNRRLSTIPVYGIDNSDPKPLRIRRLGNPLAQKRMRFKADSRGTELLVGQMKLFPTAEFDDGPDALETVRRSAIKMANEPRRYMKSTVQS